MPTWPASLPQDPSLDGYSSEDQSGMLRSEMDSGPPKQRRRFTATTENISLSWLMTKTQLSTFNSFYKTTLLEGSLAFDITHPVNGWTVSARFTAPAQRSPIYINMWRVNAVIEILP